MPPSGPLRFARRLRSTCARRRRTHSFRCALRHRNAPTTHTARPCLATRRLRTHAPPRSSAGDPSGEMTRYRGGSMNAKPCASTSSEVASPLTVLSEDRPSFDPSPRPAGSRGRTLVGSPSSRASLAARGHSAFRGPCLSLRGHFAEAIAVQRPHGVPRDLHGRRARQPFDISVPTRAAVTLVRALATNRVLVGRGKRDRPLPRFSALPRERTECDDMSARRTGCLRSTASTS